MHQSCVVSKCLSCIWCGAIFATAYNKHLLATTMTAMTGEVKNIVSLPICQCVGIIGQQQSTFFEVQPRNNLQTRRNGKCAHFSWSASNGWTTGLLAFPK